MPGTRFVAGLIVIALLLLAQPAASMVAGGNQRHGGDGKPHSQAPEGAHETYRSSASIGWDLAVGPTGDGSSGGSVSVGSIAVGSGKANVLRFDVPSGASGLGVDASWKCTAGGCKTTFTLYPPGGQDANGKPIRPIAQTTGGGWATLYLPQPTPGAWLLVASPGGGLTVASTGTMTAVAYAA
jgi:hypothetical protein